MEAITALKEFKKVIDQELETYLDAEVDKADKISPVTSEIMKQIADLTLRGGKRIRPALMYYSYLAHGGKNKKAAIRASMAIEMSESYLLIHDDIMDDGDLRRGGITIHESYRKQHENSHPSEINSKQLGIAMAINAGDIASSLSNVILASTEFKPEFVRRGLLELNNIYHQECYGQSLDVLSSIKNDISKEDILLIQRLKTVPYTFDGPVKIGALLAGANDNAIEKLNDYTVPLGTAFQIQDDILGIFGSEEKLGKPVTSDLQEGKRTLLILNALEKANPEQKEIINLNLGNKKANLYGLKAVRNVIIDTGSLDESKKIANDLMNQAIQSLEKLKLNKEGKDFLLGIAEYMIKREY